VTKNKREHLVPLVAEASKLLAMIEEMNGTSPCVFRGRARHTPSGRHAWRLRAGIWTPNGDSGGVSARGRCWPRPR